MRPNLDRGFTCRNGVPVVLQSEGAECGLACLAVIAGYYGHRTDVSNLRGRWRVSLKGVTLAQIMRMSQELHLAPRALRLELEQLGALRLPAILHWNLDHFVVLERVSSRHAWIVDPAVGRRRLSLAEVSRLFTGVALELTPAPGFQRRVEPPTLTFLTFFQGVQGLAGALARILALSLALQVFVLLVPFFSQIVIDDIVISSDRDLLAVLGAGFLLIVAIQVCVQALRAWLVVTLAANLQFGWVTRLFHHLIRLPLDYFEKRHMGDIVSRFGSVRALEQAVAQTVVEGVVDGLMAAITLAVMLFYSPKLAAVVVLAVLVYAVLRVVLFRWLRLASQEALILGARENTTFMESVRAILPLKNFGREALREAVWQNRKAESLNAEVNVRRLEVIQLTANTGIFGVENVIVIWLAALAILDNQLSVGMLVAFLAYKQQFATRAAALVDTLLELRLVNVHLERIADIALAERDEGVAAAATGGRQIAGRLEVQDLSFRYADTEPPVLVGVDLVIGAGECVAIVAPSGFGKTTLIKLMMGLLHPTAGRILVDGMDIHRGGLLADYRLQAAAVMQDDVLLSGSLADNISFFDPAPDHEWLQACAALASIHDDVQRMPMGYLTLVGDMGSTLSGGQRQRLLLARALYARPKVLFLDEATSHLDPLTERLIHAAIKQMKMTRVLVAHRSETLSVADRVIRLHASCKADKPVLAATIS